MMTKLSDKMAAKMAVKIAKAFEEEEALSDESLSVWLEALCESGCENVNQTIVSLENGEVPERLFALSDAQRKSILLALKDIMQVYQ